MKQNLNGAVAANRRNTSMMDIKLSQLIKKTSFKWALKNGLGSV